MRILLTGNGNQIEKEFASQLASQNLDILANFKDTKKFFEHPKSEDKFDLVIHCCQAADMDAEWTGEQEAKNTELDGLFAQWIQESKPGKIVYISSAAVYPADLQEHFAMMPFMEADFRIAAKINTHLGRAKAAGEMLMSALDKEFNILVPRVFSVFGPHANGRHIVPRLVKKAVSGLHDFDFEDIDAAQIRDWIHVSDVASGVLELVSKDITGTINFGLGVPTSNHELAMLFCSVKGYRPTNIFASLPTKKTFGYQCADCCVLRNNYQVKYSFQDCISMMMSGR